jgi:hypothetical protein
MNMSRITDKDGNVDDQFRALLEGLRLTIPAVAVLFSFLLTLPLQAAFSGLRTTEKVVFYVAFISASLATVLVVAPSAHQRIRAPISGIPRRTPKDVAAAAWVSIAGTVAFAISIAAASYLVSALIFGNDFWAGVITAVVAGVTGWTWFYMPVVSFSRDGREQ